MSIFGSELTDDGITDIPVIKKNPITGESINYSELLKLTLKHKSKNYALIEQLFKIIPEPMYEGKHALAYIAKMYDTDLFKILYKYCEKDIYRILPDIIQEMNIDIAYYILNNLNLNYKYGDKYLIQHILEFAVKNNKYDLVKTVLTYKNIKPTLETVLDNINLPIIEILLSSGADPNVQINNKYLIEYVFELYIEISKPESLRLKELLNVVNHLLKYPNLIISDYFYKKIIKCYNLLTDDKISEKRREFIDSILEVICSRESGEINK